MEKRSEEKAKFIMSTVYFPTKKRIFWELKVINKGKPGHPYEIPHSLVYWGLSCKYLFSLDGRTTVRLIAAAMEAITGRKVTFSHVALMKRRRKLKDHILKELKSKTVKDLEGKVLYVDATGVKVGKGGGYRGQKYNGEFKFMKLLLVVGEDGKVKDFYLADGNSAEINMLRAI